MVQQELKPRLIHTKRGAVIALCSTGYVAALSFREVLLQTQHKPPLPYRLTFPAASVGRSGSHPGVLRMHNVGFGSVLPARLRQGARLGRWLGDKFLPWSDQVSSFGTCGCRD